MEQEQQSIPKKQVEIQTYTDSSSRVQLIGEINEQALEQAPYSSWFQAGLDSYTPNGEVVSELKKYINEYDIEVFFGTWCGDSKRDVPKFYKILESAGYNLNRLHSYAVGNEGDLYKKTPNGDTDDKNISRVPTFIFYKNGVEVNRIVEHAVGASLENDMLQIASGQDYSDYHAF